jgi:phosphohistidine phosphatase
MRLYILRHGVAEDRSPSQRDWDRRLTPAGIAEMRLAAAGMRRLGLRFDAVITSPLVRARETAELVIEGLANPPALQEDERLACGAGLGEYRTLLAPLPEKAHVLLVGHEPDCSRLIADLTGGEVRMKKASLACVDAAGIAAGAGVLRWLLEAEHLAAAARVCV